MLSRRPPEALFAQAGETLEMKCVFAGEDDVRHERTMPDRQHRPPHAMRGTVSNASSIRG
jgi:hypothetical protein